MKLVIVESPAKATTIGKFLGSDYKVRASFGHIRDLPKSASEIPASVKSKPWARLGVDVDGDFGAVYVVQKESRKHIAEIKELCKNADEVILATDEDREGESISWHLLEILKPKVPVKRIAFHEITRSAIQEAMQQPRTVNDQLVRAQETRRILDRLFGYELSPVLWRKVRSKLSAGRVQSVALRLVVEREEERRAFRQSSYCDAEATLSKDGKTFKATLTSVDGKRIATGKDFDPETGKLKKAEENRVMWLQEEAAKALTHRMMAAVPWKIFRVEQKEARMRPYPPFITSTMQQAASSILNFSPRKTMQVAQKLYEGVNLGDGSREGLITYMRTDSVTLSEKALQDAGRYICSQYGEKYHQRRQFTTKSKMAQEAHEAIRPTQMDRPPESVAAFLSRDELRLYEIIWKRALASQMADATVLRTSVDIESVDNVQRAELRANGSVVVFPGFMRVSAEKQKDAELPPLEEGMTVGNAATAAIALDALVPVPHETQPPARFTEASLIKRLEDEGIGRPSTYAPTVSVIEQRGYVGKAGTALVPTYLGIAVIILLRKHFSDYVDLKFTARMEDILDDIAEGHQDWLQFIRGFYHGDKEADITGLKPSIESNLESIEFPVIPIGSDEDQQEIVVRLGKNMPFIQRGEGGEGNIASLPETLYYDELTVDKAVTLLENRAKGEEGLGRCPQTGEPVYLLEGPYGPYVQRGEGEGDEKPKRVSLPRGVSPESITLDKALQLLQLPRKLGAHPETGKSVAAGLGRFGPYVVHDGDFRSLVQEKLFNITLEEALEMLAQPKKGRAAKKLLRTLGAKPDSEASIDLYEGRYGPYVTDGTTNASLPKAMSVDTITLESALHLLAEAAAKTGTKKRATAKKKTTAKRKPAAKKKATSVKRKTTTAKKEG